MSRTNCRSLLLAAGILVILAGSALAQAGSEAAEALDVPIYLDEPGAGMRMGEMVRSGLPLPEAANVTDPDSLYMLRRDEEGDWTIEVPLQARISSRWSGTVAEGDGPAKWVLLDFPASVARSGREEYRLRYDRDGSRGTWRGGLPEGAGLASDLGDHFAIDTGALRFEIRKDRFGLFENMEVKGVRDGEEVWEKTTGAKAFEVRLVDSDGVEYLPSFVEPLEVIPEESGPLVTVFRIRGQFANGQGETLKDGWIAYTIRLHVYAGSAFARLFFTLENNGLYGLEADWSVRDNTPKWLFFDSLSLDLVSQFEGETRLDTGAVREPVGEDGEGTFRLYQDHAVRRIPEDLVSEAQNFFYEVQVGDRTVYRDARSPGVVRLSDGFRSVAAGVRHFWQNYPKAVSFRDGRLSLELWPSEGFWPNNEVGREADTYQFEGGRHKTYEVGYDFTPNGGTDPVALATRLGKPLFGRSSSEWYARTEALDFLAPNTFPVGNRAITTALRRFNQMHEAYVDVTRAEPQPKSGDGIHVVPPISIYTQREQRGNAFRIGDVENYVNKLKSAEDIEFIRGAGIYNVDMYGWFNFGDLPHVYGWSSLHHDWPYGMFLQYLRHEGKREFLDLGEEMVRHRYDIDQYHNEEDDHENWWFFNGFQRFNRGWHGDYDRYESYRSEHSPMPGYTWLEGLLLHHQLTGDPRSLEAARENADAFYEYYRIHVGVTEKRSPVRQIINLRHAAMAIKGLVEFYGHTGEARYRDMAYDIYANHLRYTEELVGNNGFLFWEARQELETLLLVLEPLRKLHMVVDDPEILSVMARALYRLKKIYLEVSGYTDLGRYMPLQLPIVWVAGRPNGSEIWYGYEIADAFAYLYLETGEESYMEFARWLFHDSVIYFQAHEYKLVKPEFESEISYNPRKYPHTESVTNAAVMRGHQVYLTAEWKLAAEGAPKFHFPYDEFHLAGGARSLMKEDAGRVPVRSSEEATHRRRTPDFTPPRVTVKDIESGSGRAEITVVTDEKANVQIEYGTDTRHTVFTPRPFRADIIHEVRLTGLQSDATYYFRVHAIDLAENRTRTEFVPLKSVKDREPPNVIRASAPEEDRVVVEFSEPVNSEDAEDEANFRIEGVTVSEAIPDPSGRRTLLITSRLRDREPYEIRVSGIRDLASPPNEIAGSAVAAPRRFYREILADDSGAAFRVLEGDWGQTTTDLDTYGGEMRFAKISQPDGKIARAEWRVPVPEDGYYEVYAWWPKSPLVREAASRVQYRVRYYGGLSTLVMNQRLLGGQWVRLGTLPFRATDGALVTLSTDGADGTVLADAIRLVYTTAP